MIPKAGSAYTYGYVVLGEIVGWFIGWDLLLEYTAIVAVVAIGISGYFSFLMSEHRRGPAGLDAGRAGHRGRARGGPVRRRCCACSSRSCSTAGIRAAARVETGVVVIKVAVVLLVVVVGVLPRQGRQLPALLPVRRGRGDHRRRHGLLRRLRLRRDEHRRRGVPRRAAAPAPGDHLFAGRVDGAVRARHPGADRDAELPGHRPGERLLLRVRLGRAVRAGRRHRGRRDHRHPHRHVHLHAGRDPGLVRDEPRRPAAGLVRPDCTRCAGCPAG